MDQEPPKDINKEERKRELQKQLAEARDRQRQRDDADRDDSRELHKAEQERAALMGTGNPSGYPVDNNFSPREENEWYKDTPTRQGMDLEALAQRIQSEITGLPEEERQQRAIELLLAEKEAWNEEQGGAKEGLRKFDKWWDGLEKTKGGVALKALIGGALITATTVGLGVAPVSLLGVGFRLTSRVAAATGLNMALTSERVRKWLTPKEDTGSPKTLKEKVLTVQNLKYAAMIGGAGLIFMMGGAQVAVVGATGMALRFGVNQIIEKRTKALEEKRKNLSIRAESLQDNFDINALAAHLEVFEEEYGKLSASLTRNKWAKNLVNGAITVGVGLGTMAVAHHGADTTHAPKEVPDKPAATVTHPHQPEVTTRPTAEPVVQPKEEVDTSKVTDWKKVYPPGQPTHPITPEVTLNPDAIIKPGDGIESAFIRQIEHNDALATKLGWDGESDLHKFAQGEAHRMARDYGYIDKTTGEEVRVESAGKIAYEIRTEGDKIEVIEKSIKGDILDTHEKGNAFEKETDKYEKLWTKPEETANNILKPTNTYGDMAKDAPGALPESADTTPAEEVTYQKSEIYKDDAWRNRQASEEELERTRRELLEKMGTKTEQPHTETSMNGHTEPSPGPEAQVGGHLQPKGDYSGDLAPRQVEALRLHSEFIQNNNTYLLSDSELWETYEASRSDLRFLFSSENSIAWHELDDMNASALLTQVDSGTDSAQDHLVRYLHVLQNFTEPKLEPRRGILGIGAEHVKDFMARAMIQLKHNGNLEVFQESIRK
ncbi:MAG: hypothetical protein WCT29_02905 [Candidatus Paceibacterota bacterium]|jgi:hypothetical protein